MLAHVVASTLAWPVSDVWVVLGYEAERILDEGGLPDLPVVLNPDWADGLASSLRVGLDAVSRGFKGEWCFIVMGDQPSIDPDVVETLLSHAQVARAPVVAPRYRYTWSNPMLVGRRVWPKLMNLTGDHGALGMLKAHPDWVEEVWFDRLPPRDVDTAADFEELAPRRKA